MANTAAPPLPTAYEPLRQQLLAAAREFATASKPLGDLLNAMVDDVGRAASEPLEIFPVCHHSPSAAIHMVRRLRASPPRVIFLEMCEDLRPVVDKLRDCKLPVALQAFAGETTAFPKSWTPLSVVAPFSEFSAEFQAVAFALENPSTTDLVFVDRSVDHVFQWMPQKEEELEKHLGEETEAEEPDPSTGEQKPHVGHGAGVGVQVGDLEPTFGRFREFLLQNARVKHFAEWWDQYVEQAVLGSDYETYRSVLFLVGSLLRRLGQRREEIEKDCVRERYMWTRMKVYLQARKFKPNEALHICGAIHAASDVEEFGTTNNLTWEIPPRTTTPWLYGIIPSSHQAIDAQFHLPPGTITLAMVSWEKARRGLGLKPFVLTAQSKAAPAKGKKGKAKGTEAEPAEAGTPTDAVELESRLQPVEGVSLLDFLTRPPVLATEDEEQLLDWSVRVVELARKNGYLSSTADSIAVYHTAVLLAQMRNRRHPSPYDFRDAAVTCLEKDRIPGKRNVSRLCDILLGGDRVGQVGFSSLPPLAQDVMTRLKPLGLNLSATAQQRALLDLRSGPDLLPCSDLLWKLRYLLQGRTVRPIMGERALGQTPVQESWDLSFGKDQTPLITLGYEGVTVEHVLEKRLREKAFGAQANAVTALEAAEDSILYLKSVRLTEEIGSHGVDLLVQETGAQSAPQIFERVRRLLHYYRSTPDGLPAWIGRFVATGYSHYCTLLPSGLGDRGTSPDQVAGMLAFIFNLESLALSLGCNRSQLQIAVAQAAAVTNDPNKTGLLWTAEWLLGKRDVESIREFFGHLLENRMALASLPAYLNGFLLALRFTPLVARLTTELLSRAFERLPDSVLLPWLPGLLVMLRRHGGSVLPGLLKEASASFPGTLAGLKTWRPPWEAAPAAAAAKPTAAATAALGPAEAATAALLRGNRAAPEAMAALLGVDISWPGIAPGGATLTASGGRSSAERAVQELLAHHPAASETLAKLLGI